MSASKAPTTMMRSKKKDVCIKPSRKLDKRSSRGVMFENEELRMRTIEINAEVDRGQTDLRKLKRENEALKNQVWTLRDEYDKLEHFVGTMSDEDDDDDDDTDEDNLDQRHSQPRISEEDEDDLDDVDDEDDDDDDDDDIDTDNLENIQKIYSGKMHSVEYVRQSSSMEGARTSNGCGSSHGAGPSVKGCPTAVDSLPPPGAVRVRVPEDASQDFPSAGDNTTAGPADDHLPPPPPDNYVDHTEHFNLDQLLDFASSFHYDRRKHLAEEPTLAMALPPEDEGSNSPTREITDPGYSTVRRRSATVLEKLKSGSNTGALVKEVKQLSLCKDGSSGSAGIPICDVPDVSHTTTVTYTRSSYFYAGSLDASRSQSLGTGLNAAGGVARSSPATPATPLYSSNSASNIGTSSSLEAGLPLVSVYAPRASLVRLNSIEPNTVMMSVAEMPQLWDISTQEIIDELEQQAGEAALASIRGVRVVGRAAYISLGRRDCLQQLMSRGLTVRGGKVPLIDITRESIVLALTGVPHYIADATLVILLSAFGTIIGEIERRFYKGVDTGERFVRMKLKKHVKLPKYVTVGGCRIVLTVHGRDILAQSHVTDWQGKMPSSCNPPPTPHVSHPPDVTHTDLTTPVSPDSGQCSEPSSSDKSCERVDGRDSLRTDMLHSDCRSNSKSGKTFSSRCIVNLKLPERPSTGAHTHPRDTHGTREAERQGGGGAQTPSTPMGAGHVLRAGTLYRGRGNDPPLTPVGCIAPSPLPGRRLTRLGSIGAATDLRTPDSPRPRPNSVVFDEQPREGPPQQSRAGLLTPQYQQHQAHVAASAATPTPLANGILRKASGSESESLLPGQGATATIRNRLKIGRSMSYDAGKQKLAEKEKKRLGKMESISENTINDDVSDITPLGAGGRRDSEKSSLSANSKSSGNSKKKEPVIDLPWCGCWGNGCF